MLVNGARITTTVNIITPLPPIIPLVHFLEIAGFVEEEAGAMKVIIYAPERGILTIQIWPPMILDSVSPKR